MCGIFGKLGPGRGPLDGLRARRDLLTHRGPDAPGEYVNGDVYLGVRRLRIIDLVTGDQPIANEDQTVWAIHNGEIYNFRELRGDLEARGHHFATQSDTEVLVHGYEEFGTELPSRLEGMFAFAVWDAPRRRLLLARDRLGKKPLLYAIPRPGCLAFASEFEALVRDPDVDASLDHGALDLYLSFGFVPAPRTVYRGVHKLPPAHRLVWEDATLDLAPYWSLPQHGTREPSESEAVAELIERLRTAVRARLVADVPLGAYLSGGVDSSLVVALMAREAGAVRTFSIGFEDADYSELEHARRVARRYATEHHELVVRPDVEAVLPLLARRYGEPYADSSAVPTYYLARMARERVTVVLNGDGGDEAFCGYDRYRAMQLAARLDLLPAGVRQALAAAGLPLLAPRARAPSPALRAQRFLEALPLAPEARYLAWVGVFTEAQKEHLLHPDVRCALDDAADPVALMAQAMRGSRAAEMANAADLALYLPDDLLAKVDIASMANSLEVRSPFLDREVVEFGVSLPLHLKIRGAVGKYLLKRAAEALVPRENLYRPKMGFGVPIGRWFRGKLRGLLEDTILSPRALQRGYFRPEAVRALVAEHCSERRDHTQRLWALVMLEQWHRELVDRR